MPPDVRHAALARDYHDMRLMFLGEPMPFPELMQQLAAAEQTINSM